MVGEDLKDGSVRVRRVRRGLKEEGRGEEEEVGEGREGDGGGEEGDGDGGGGRGLRTLIVHSVSIGNRNNIELIPCY